MAKRSVARPERKVVAEQKADALDRLNIQLVRIEAGAMSAILAIEQQGRMNSGVATMLRNMVLGAVESAREDLAVLS